MRKHAIGMLLVTLTGCAAPTTTTGTRVRIAVRAAVRIPGEHFTETQRERIAATCWKGMPQETGRWDLGPSVVVIRPGYVLRHSSIDKIPLWVCEHVTKAQLGGPLTRDGDPFAPDPMLEKGSRAELRDYKGSGYDRGHQAPAGDETVSQARKDETFYLSNMAPQNPRLNQHAWAGLETLVRAWAIRYGEVYVVTGPMIWAKANDLAEAAGGAIKFKVKVIGPDHVAVPTHFFKIVAARFADGTWHEIAFVLENRDYPKPYDFAREIEPVSWIEERTGLDFMPELTAEERRSLEMTAAGMWPQ